MSLTAEEKSKCVRALGLAETDNYTSASGPIVQTLSVRTNLAQQMEQLTSFGEARVREILGVLDTIEGRMSSGAIRRLAATKVGEIGIREDEEDALEKEYRRWGFRLGEALGCSPNLMSKRYSGGGICGSRAVG